MSKDIAVIWIVLFFYSGNISYLIARSLLCLCVWVPEYPPSYYIVLILSSFLLVISARNLMEDPD